jgi:hypothetical protein
MTKLFTIAAAVAVFAFPAFADVPNRVTMSWPEFVEASGCTFVDKGGYSNLAAKDGGNCPRAVVTAFWGVGSKTLPGADGILGTADDIVVSDN